MKEKIPSVRKQDPSIPQAVENIIIKAAAKNPRNRYDSAKEMHEDLLHCLDEEHANDKKITESDYNLAKRFLTKYKGYYYGDVNGDGKLTTADSKVMLEFATSKRKPNYIQIVIADINGDGKILARDVQLVQRIISKYGDVATAIDYTKPDGKKTKEDIDLITAFANSTKKPINDMQKKAADVNKDGKITKADADILAGKSTNKVTISFVLNGAKSITGNGIEECTLSNSTSTCNVQFPKITPKDGFEVIGWSTNKASTTAEVLQGAQKAIKNSQTYYAITKSKNPFSAFFTYNNNYVLRTSDVKKECYRYNGESSCLVSTPTVSAKSGYTPYGWIIDGSNLSSTSGIISSNQIAINSSTPITYKAVLKATNYFTITFKTSGLDYFEYLGETPKADYVKKYSCIYYITDKNQYVFDKSCDFKMPEFNKKGYYNQYWSEYPSGSSDLKKNNVSYSEALFIPVGQTRIFTKNVTFYPNYNNKYYSKGNNTSKFRAISIKRSFKIGKTLYEFENGIPDSTINTFKNEMEKAYGKYNKVLFSPAKVFVMTYKTYNNYSWAYALTHTDNSAYSIIDLQYDENGVIDVNGALHELGHAWDSYYRFKTGTYIVDTNEFINFYNSLKYKLTIEDTKKVVADNTKNIDTSKQITLSEAKKIEKNAKVGDIINIYINRDETWAAMVTNYYWHVLKMNDNQAYYALKSKLNSTELNTLKGIIETKISQSKGWY